MGLVVDNTEGFAGVCRALSSWFPAVHQQARRGKLQWCYLKYNRVEIDRIKSVHDIVAYMHTCHVQNVA